MKTVFLKITLKLCSLKQLKRSISCSNLGFDRLQMINSCLGACFTFSLRNLFTLVTRSILIDLFDTSPTHKSISGFTMSVFIILIVIVCHSVFFCTLQFLVYSIISLIGSDNLEFFREKKY